MEVHFTPEISRIFHGAQNWYEEWGRSTGQQIRYSSDLSGREPSLLVIYPMLKGPVGLANL
jgi:hypothetical protein